jgi:ubiquinone biosynthesis protein Coq4
MFTLTEEEKKALLNHSDAAVVAATKKLIAAEESGEFVPKSRLADVLKDKKIAEDALAKLEADRKKKEEDALRASGDLGKLLDAEKKAREEDRIAHEQTKAQLEIEKKEADQSRAYKKAAVESVKKQMGDKWLPEYETFSLESLAKLPGITLPTIGVETGAARPITPPAKDFAKMDSKDFQKEVEAAKRGELKTDTTNK